MTGRIPSAGYKAWICTVADFSSVQPQLQQYSIVSGNLKMPISIIIGNGFSIDARTHFNLPYDPNKPWDWDIRNPYNSDQRLLDVLPSLKNHLLNQGKLASLPIYKSLENIVKTTQFSPIYKLGDSHKVEDQIHNEACHYLRIAYAWYSMQITDDVLKTWQWFQWF